MRDLGTRLPLFPGRKEKKTFHGFSVVLVPPNQDLVVSTFQCLKGVFNGSSLTDDITALILT